MNESKTFLKPYEICEIKETEEWLNDMSAKDWELETFLGQFAIFKKNSQHFTYKCLPKKYDAKGMDFVCNISPFSNKIKIYKQKFESINYINDSEYFDEFQKKLIKRDTWNAISIIIFAICFILYSFYELVIKGSIFETTNIELCVLFSIGFLGAMAYLIFGSIVMLCYAIKAHCNQKQKLKKSINNRTLKYVLARLKLTLSIIGIVFLIISMFICTFQYR